MGYKEIVVLEDMYDVMIDLHKNTSYQGRDAMTNEAKKNYCNVTR
jgi:hypothetical protein